MKHMMLVVDISKMNFPRGLREGCIVLWNCESLGIVFIIMGMF